MRWTSPMEYVPKAVWKPQTVAKVVACSSLLFLAGCNIPKLCRAEKGPALPKTFVGQTTAQSSAAIGIDDFFTDPALTCLIAEGLTSNQELKIRNQEVRIANAEILARRGAYLPFVSLRAEGGLEKNSKYTPLGAAEEHLTYPGGRHFPDPLGNSLLSADFLWRVDIWREFRNARDAAMQRRVEAVERRDFFVTQLVAEIAESYYELAALDKRLDFLDQTIAIQRKSIEVAEAQKAAARGTELGVQRFIAEVRKNESQRLIVTQQIIEVENKINFLVGRYPQPVERISWDFIHLDSRPLCVGIPAQLLLNRRDIRAAEREVAAAGLDVLVARARFFPRLDITASVGFEAFDPRYLFDPESFFANVAGGLVAPLINKRAIQAEYISANARQLQAIYDYQRTVLNAFTEVANRVAKVENYRRSVEFKQGQVKALEESVEVATLLFQNARAEYVEVLLSQRDLLEARTDLIETKQEQLSAIVNAYQALGGGYLMSKSGQGFSDVFCPDEALNPSEVYLPPVPEDMLGPNAPGSAVVPNSTEELAPPPVPGEAEVHSDSTGNPQRPKLDQPPASSQQKEVKLPMDSDKVQPLFTPGKNEDKIPEQVPGELNEDS